MKRLRTLHRRIATLISEAKEFYRKLIALRDAINYADSTLKNSWKDTK